MNPEMEEFTIFKGIESDILPDGSLDYDERFSTVRLCDCLGSFPFQYVGGRNDSKGDESPEKPLITTILGHPTGRLLLARGTLRHRYDPHHG